MPLLMAGPATYVRQELGIPPSTPRPARLSSSPARPRSLAFAKAMLGQERIESSLAPARLLRPEDRPQGSPRNGISFERNRGASVGGAAAGGEEDPVRAWTLAPSLTSKQPDKQARRHPSAPVTGVRALERARVKQARRHPSAPVTGVRALERARVDPAGPRRKSASLTDLSASGTQARRGGEIGGERWLAPPALRCRTG